MNDLVYGWGNDKWVGQNEFLAGSVEHAFSAKGPILEVGSGLSTILVGAIAARCGQSHFALEHLPEWAGRVQGHLDRFNLRATRLCETPITDYGDYAWYDVASVALPHDFSLVICDGPPGSTLGGRYGLIPAMKNRLRPGCVILLDDAHREQERAVAERWGAELGALSEVLGEAKPYIRLTVPGSSAQ